VGLIGCALGLVGGLNFSLFLFLGLNRLGLVAMPLLHDLLGPDRIILLWQGSWYMVCLSTFHSAEFFTSALYNPLVTTADSFLVNHSTTYTAAALVSGLEWSIHFLLFPHYNSPYMCWIGVFLVILAQTIRSLAMITCGTSFNHLIQTSKKDNHVLVTHGIYHYFRHPSYVGFFYWSIGMQLILSNFFSAPICALASWVFFRRRIPYEEESLVFLFPKEYPSYVQRTWVGIPLVPCYFVQEQPDETEERQELPPGVEWSKKKEK
jgi:protein-S-isoprenylcysteine O-methyltransferase